MARELDKVFLAALEHPRIGAAVSTPGTDAECGRFCLFSSSQPSKASPIDRHCL